MEVPRSQLTTLLNALYDSDNTPISVSHPSDDIGELLRIDLDEAGRGTVRLAKDLDAYGEARSAVNSEHGEPAISELPHPQSYLRAFLAGGLLSVANEDALRGFLDSNGYRDLNAGHRPVVAGFDTNLLPWRIATVLGLTPSRDSAVNGFALANGVLDELEWGSKRKDTQSLAEAFGPAFEELWNQSAGSSREGRLGQLHYRQLRDTRYAEEFTSDRGDDEIIDGYAAFQNEGLKDVLLFSNDRDFIENARSHRVLAHRVEFPTHLPSTMTGSWAAIQDTLYILTVLFGVLEVPKTTLYGVWRGKGGMAWHDERLRIDCRSPKLEPLIERDLAIIEAYERT